MTDADREQLMLEAALERSVHDVSMPSIFDESFASLSSHGFAEETDVSSETPREISVRRHNESERLARMEQYMIQEAMKRSMRDVRV